MDKKENICVSIFMLTYNQEEFIGQAIEGVLMQKTSFSYQLVIGEDCSTDGTRDICQKYAATHPEKVKLILNNENIGLGANYVKTYAKCTGKYIAICDGDDYWIDPLKLQKQVDFLESNSNYDVVFTNNENLYPSGKRHIRDISEVPNISSFRELVFGNYIASVTVLFRQKNLSESLENLIKNLPYGDWPTYLWITKDGGKVRLLDEVTAVYRKDFGTSTVLRQTKNRWGEINLSILECIQKLPEFEQSLPEIEKAINKLMTGLMANYNKENYFLKSLRLLGQLSLRQNFLYTGKIYLYSFKRKVFERESSNVMLSMRKILFITHDTSRSGAPLVLLAFMRWTKKNYPEIKIGLVALRKGHMFEDFNKVADKVYNIPGNTFYTRIRMKFISNRPFFSASFVRELKKENFDLVYANTVSSIPLGVAVKGTKLIAHIHELPTTMKILLPSFEDYDGFVNTYIAPSQMVAEKLVSDFSILPHKVKVIYEFSKKLQPRSHKPKGKVFKVGAAGTFHWRKGSDVFLQVARYVKDHYPEYDIQFIWIGKVPESEKLIAEADIRKMGLQNKIKFTGLVENPENYYRELDVFLLPSREDPFPLVCIEVGMIGLPIICFENATGISEILNYGGGAIIPYLNIEKVSKQIIKYFENPEYLKEHGDKNKEQFSQLTPENKSPEIFSILKLVTEKNSAELL